MLRRLKRLVVFVGAAMLFVMVSVLCGLLVAGLAIPVATASGVGARAADRKLAELPTELDAPKQAQRTKVLDGGGDVLAYFYDENRIYVGLEEIAPVMRSALLSIEDHRFYQHGAFDPVGTIRAFLTNTASGSTVQGGSSITQQYVKMVLVNAASLAGDEEAVRAAQAPTYRRKMTELRYAIALEQKLGKDEILERYLNIAYFGDGAYGVEAAARHYFDTTAAKLTLPQAAMLAGLVKSPDAYNPVQHPEVALDRRDDVIDRMAELGQITTKAAERARRSPFDPDAVQPAGNGCVASRYPFLCDYVRRSLLQLPSLGDSVREREQRLNRGGLTIRTAIDPKAQDAAQRAVSKLVAPTDPLISTMNMIEPGTGKIVAMAQSRSVMGNDTKKGETFLNYSVPQPMGGSRGFQAGSTFKAFVAAAALDHGIPIAKTYRAKPKMDFSGARFATCDGLSWIDDWTVHNGTPRSGVMNMAEAAAFSVNTYFIQLELEVGMCAVTRTTTRLGVESSIPDRPISYYDDKPSFTLGTAEVSPMSMAEAYATFAAGGIHCEPRILSSVRTADGTLLEVPGADCKRVLPADVADAVNWVLAEGIRRGSAKVVLDDGRDQAGKTGTIENSEAVWFVGYTPEISGAAMISVDHGRRPWINGEPGYRADGLDGYRVPSTGKRLHGSGGRDAGPKIWRPAISAYLQDRPATEFGEPSDRLRYGPMITIPDLVGQPAEPAIRRLERIGLTVRQQTRVSDEARPGRVLQVKPQRSADDPTTAENRIRKYGTVEVIVSRRPKKPKPSDSGDRAGGDRAGGDRAGGDRAGADDRAGGDDGASAERRRQPDRRASDDDAGRQRADRRGHRAGTDRGRTDPGN